MCLSRLGYVPTSGKACTYWANGNIRLEYYINSRGERDGLFKAYDINNNLVDHFLYKNNFIVVDFLKK